MPSTVVTFALTLDGSVDDFDEAATAALKASLEATLGCIEPACLLKLTLAASSVAVQTTMTIPNYGDDDQGAPPAVAAAVHAVASNLTALPPASISSVLSDAGASVSVVAAAAPTVATGISVPLAVAPPPPSPPPTQTEQSPKARRRRNRTLVIAVSIAGGALVCVVLFVCYALWRKGSTGKKTSEIAMSGVQAQTVTDTRKVEPDLIADKI